MFLPDAGLRSHLSLPSAERVDYRAACFCHRELIDVSLPLTTPKLFVTNVCFFQIGYVCSVCLSIFCKFSPMCTTCHTFFKAPGPLPVMAKKRKGAAAAGASPAAAKAARK